MGNVMVIYPQPNEKKKPRFGFSYNWAMIATILHNGGNTVSLHDYSCENFDSYAFTNQLNRDKIHLVIIEFDSFALKRSENNIHGYKLVQLIKDTHPHIVVIAYGYYCCITSIDIHGVDCTIKENNINHILSSINKLLPGSFSLIQHDQFDELPFIDRNLLSDGIDYYHQHKTSTLIQTAIGCENTCAFCQRKGWQNHYISHTDNYVVTEFELLKQQGYKNIWITDENFTFQLPRAKNILSMLVDKKITSNMKIAISSWVNIDDEFLYLASQAQIKSISFGIETGNTEIMQFYHKNIDLEKARRIIKTANKYGIFTIGNLIIGAPIETHDTIQETFALINECEFDQLNIKTLDYMIGSDLYTALGKDMQNNTHIFACKESGLNNFSLEELVQIKTDFLNNYYEGRKDKLMKKIEIFGTPFDLVDNCQN